MRIPTRFLHAAFWLALPASAIFTAAPARASELNLPPEATEAIQLIYVGKLEDAFRLARKIEAARPEHPLGYLVEADILWWRIYCKWSAREYNTIDAWSHTRPADEDDVKDLALADKVIELSQAAIAKSDTAEMELYAGLGYASRARLLALRFQKLPVAHAGVESRRHLLRCLELDPNMADANLGLGLYNYYVDALPTLVKILRFFIGIPNGDRHTGLRQLEIASSQGELTRVEARFNMAKSMRNIDLNYPGAAKAAEPLLAMYPQNPLFLLLSGDLDQKTGHPDSAAAKFRAAGSSPQTDAACIAQMQKVSQESLATLANGN